ncbi:hypothetical protein BDP81DRAFT_161809 [Colletotrichum phormii]|uniref:Uncharacterized protein n=1 Tax=Colletotrichum phormii TaxID=359342 RepID=A0AAI9ZY45_9PEZI|nr:uncharacterized protein BDP81DRAFT_161809 [Colletotrichum phormii]KAK1640336.1 hypothetical protein BDP81DRAFT_161809 [Colletotrichum phormii]
MPEPDHELTKCLPPVRPSPVSESQNPIEATSITLRLWDLACHAHWMSRPYLIHCPCRWPRLRLAAYGYTAMCACFCSAAPLHRAVPVLPSPRKWDWPTSVPTQLWIRCATRPRSRVTYPPAILRDATWKLTWIEMRITKQHTYRDLPCVSCSHSHGYRHTHCWSAIRAVEWLLRATNTTYTIPGPRLSGQVCSFASPSPPPLSE